MKEKEPYERSEDLLPELLKNPHLKENPFSVPADYFEQIQAQWRTDTTQEDERAALQLEWSSKRRLWNFLKPQLAFAAGFALLFGIGYGLLTLSTRNMPPISEFDEISLLDGSMGQNSVYRIILEEMGFHDTYEDENASISGMDLDEMIEYLHYQGVDIESLRFNEFE